MVHESDFKLPIGHYALYAEDKFGWLAPKVDPLEFPDPQRFPPPKDAIVGANWRMTRSRKIAGREGLERDLVYEILWQPVWWTTRVEKGDNTLSFFQGVSRTRRTILGSGCTERDPPLGACFPDPIESSVGCFSWPTEFTIWEVELAFVVGDRPHAPVAPVHDALLSPASEGNECELNVRIGEFSHFRVNVRDMYLRSTHPYSRFVSLLWPLHIPAVQNYRPMVSWAKGAPRPGMLRCVLHGYLHREVV